MSGRWPRLFVALPALAAALALSRHFFVQPLRPWPDQGWVLQAAVRHAHGQGLTNLSLNPDDLTEPRPHQLVYFPPLYSLVVSALLQAGLSADVAVKGINAAALAAGVLGWVGLAIRWLRGVAWQGLFAVLLVVAGSAAIPKGGTADYALWAATPYWLALLVAARSAESAGRARLFALGASLLVAVLIGFRWAAVVYVPVGGLVLLWPDPAGRGLFVRCMTAVLYGLPGAGSYLLITAVNRHLSSGGDLLAFVTPGWRFYLLPTPYPLESVTTIPLALEPLLNRLGRALGSAAPALVVSVVVRVAVPLVLLAVLAWAGRKTLTRGSPAERPTELWLAAGSLLAGTILFLAYMTVRYNWDHVEWTYLDEPRYFRPLWPSAALLWLTALEGLSDRGPRAAAYSLMAVGVVYLLQAQARTEYQELTRADESWELVEQVRALDRRDRPQLVFDNDVSDYIVTAGPILFASLYPDPEQAAGLKVSRPADLWLVRRVSEQTAYVRDPEYDARRFDALATRFGVEKVWASSGGNYELYHARIAPVAER